MNRRKYFKKYHTTEKNNPEFNTEEYFKKDNQFIDDFKSQFTNFEDKKNKNYSNRFKNPQNGNLTSKTIITTTKIGPDGIPITETHETNEISELDKYGNEIPYTKKVYSNNNFDYDLKKIEGLRVKNDQRIREAQRRDMDYGNIDHRKNYDNYSNEFRGRDFGSEYRKKEFDDEIRKYDDEFRKNKFRNDFGDKNYDYEVTKTVRNNYDDYNSPKRVKKQSGYDENFINKEKVKKRMNNLQNDNIEEEYKLEDHTNLIEEWNRVASSLKLDPSEW